MRLRLASYNVRSFRGGVDLAVQALGSHPDLILVQECGSRRAVRRFGRALGMAVVSSHRPFRRIRNAVIVPPEWRVQGVEDRAFAREGAAVARGFLAVHLRVGPARLTAVSAHFGLSARERAAHARELTDWMAGLEGPVVLGADLNEGPEGSAVRWIAQRLFDGHVVAGLGSGATFPAAEPTARIDYVFVNGDVRVLSCQVVESTAAAAASDHRPVVAELELAEAP
ncbi:MAG TPA: endonuclease/exonuclease/phosphatase family protein [Actinomycetota bacterium]|nr:endonuclease/exonuclease/phosphatase family protein [Actinomycetota bacterium]